MADWEARLARVKAELAPALALAGEWVGEGQAHGDPIVAQLRVRPILDGTMLEVWERVGEHEDLSIYRFDVDTGQLRVLHLMAGAVVAEHPVEVVPGALVWVTPPKEPAVEWTVEGDTLRCEVIWPGQRIAEVSVRYRRA
ncbi:MAG: hypothetical protein ACOZNI_01515 [Myxococcota bacterium]